MELAVSITFDARGTVPMGARLTDCVASVSSRTMPCLGLNPPKTPRAFCVGIAFGIVGIVLETAHNARIYERGADVEKVRPRAHHFAENGWPSML